MKKVCNICLIEKELCDFYVDKTYKDGVSNKCKQCIKEHYIKNREKIKSNSKEYYIKNREKVLSLNKEYNIKNKEKQQPYKKEYRINNREKIKEYRINNREKEISRKKEYYIKNKEKRKQYNIENRENKNNHIRNRRLNDPIYKLIGNVRSRLYLYLKSTGITKNKRTFDGVGCSPPELKEHLEKQFVDGMSWEIMGKEIHIDHIIPLSSAKTEEEIYKLSHYTNLQPLWAEDNLKKSNNLYYLL